MKVLIHYRDKPALDEICDAEPATDPTVEPGSLYVTGEHFGTIVRPDQHNDNTWPVWYEELDEVNVQELRKEQLIHEINETREHLLLLITELAALVDANFPDEEDKKHD